MEIKERVEIGCYTKMSEMKGISSVKEYIDEAKKRGWKAIGISDINSVQAFVEAQEYLERDEENQLKIIYGVKARFIDDENLNEINNIIILVKEQKGLKNLYTILSNAFSNKPEGENLIYRSQLDKYRDGLLYGTFGLNGEVYKKLYYKEQNEQLDEKIKYYDFIQIEPIYNAKKRDRRPHIIGVRIIDETIKLQEINKNLIELGEKNNVLVVASSNSLFVNKEDSICNEILNHSKGILDCEYDNERYLHTTEEMLEKFNYLDNEKVEKIVIDNTNNLADMCEEINPISRIESEERYPEIENSKEIIKDECYKNVHNIYGKELPKEVKERLELELNSIIENGFETIYLIANDCVKKSNELGYPVGARGCVGNSFVAFLLGITDYNPIDYDLPFEIFSGKNYDKEPDIALNFSREICEEIHEYIKGKYGRDNVIYCGTVGTIAEKTAAQMVENYSDDLEFSIDEKRKKEIIEKIVGIKRTTGVHPGGIFIIPKNKDINEFTPIYHYKFNNKSLIKTHMDYHLIRKNGLYIFDVLSNDTQTILHRLKLLTNVDYKEIDLNDKETLAIFLNAGNEKYEISTKGIPEFKTKFMIDMLKLAKPKSFFDLICLNGLAHGTDTWCYNAEYLIKSINIPIQNLISNRDDIMNYLISKGIEKNIAFDITDFIRKGKAAGAKKYNYIDQKNDRNEKLLEQWNEYKEIMTKHDIPEWYIKSCKKIKYLFPKAHSIGYTVDAFRIAWYKVHYPEAFYKVYFEIGSNIDTKKHTNKEQIERKIIQLEEQVETELNLKYTYEIEDLKILLEMYNSGIIKEEIRKKDDYDLINSRAIGEYCREIGHKFNTEELAVLVYRNKKMDITEKIEKYKDLIENYPDMEVIERINCEHYDSVKSMIKQEIERLQNLRTKLCENEDGVIYTYEMHYTSTREWDKPWKSLENIKTSFFEIDKEIEEYIEEFNDVLAYRVRKKYLDGSNPTITAEYQVFNKRKILTNFYDSENNFLDIDNIFLNIPTPFKKGDLLVSWNNIPYRKGLLVDNKDVFVLDWLCTWKEGLNETLAKGNYDSSDMIGYGYYMYEDSNKFVRDHKWEYDSFEYYEGELKGIYRTLQAISSFMKNKISLELFVHACEEYKSENRRSLLDWYTEDGLKLAGCSENDIYKYTKGEETKIYNMPEDERMDYIKYQTDGLTNIEENDIKQIETDYYNKVFVLLNNGNLYRDGDLIDNKICKIHMFDGMHLYKITEDNKIKPIYEDDIMDNIDKYLNNENCSYKKIVTSTLHIVALTTDGNVRAIHGLPTGLGIEPENFKNVEDISIVEETKDIEVPYIFKNKEYKPLYTG